MPDNPIFKSRAMLRVEKRIERPLEEYFAEAYEAKTQEQIASELKISTASVSRWMRELGVETRLQGQRPPEAAQA